MKNLSKKKIFLFVLFALVLLFVSSEDSNAAEGYSQWRIGGGTVCYCFNDVSCPGGYSSDVGYSSSCTYQRRCCGTYGAPQPLSACGGGATGSSSPPYCGPPPPRCGDGSCNSGSGETCNTCSTDCGRCMPTLSEWCGRNCVAANSRPDSSYNNCGEGWTGWSTMWCRALPPGEECGTCKGGALCGDGKITSPETCDDKNKNNGDGCSSSCQIEFGFNCPTVGQLCSSSCGDGRKASNEACDDGNRNNNDGCSSSCTVETSYICAGNNPSTCSIRIEPGGCADFNDDRKVDIRDLFVLSDCAGARSPVGACNTKNFNRADWNDDNSVDATYVPPRLCNQQIGFCGDLDGNGFTDLNDFFIFGDCTGGKTYGNCNPTIFDKIDFNKNRIIDGEEIERMKQESVIGGRDGSCFMQNLWKTSVTCPQSCNYRIRGEICSTDPECIESGVSCSLGKYNDLSVGHCCPDGSWWDPTLNNGNGACTTSALGECAQCQKTILRDGPAFFKDQNCWNPSAKKICILTNAYSKESKPFLLEILKRN